MPTISRLSRGLSGKASAYRAADRFDPWVGKIPWRRAWQPTPVFLPGESRGQRTLAGYSPWGRRVRPSWSDWAQYTPSRADPSHSLLNWRLGNDTAPQDSLTQSEGWVFQVLCELDATPSPPWSSGLIPAILPRAHCCLTTRPPPALPQISQTDSRCRILHFLLSLCWKWPPHGHVWGFLTPHPLFTQVPPSVSRLWLSYLTWQFLPSPSLHSSPELRPAFNLPRFP